MSESKIIEALIKFKADYAWDKSLNTQLEPATLSAPSDASFSSNYLDEFMRSEQAKLQQDKL